jgi:hypothetical protein
MSLNWFLAALIGIGSPMVLIPIVQAATSWSPQHVCTIHVLPGGMVGIYNCDFPKLGLRVGVSPDGGTVTISGVKLIKNMETK